MSRDRYSKRHGDPPRTQMRSRDEYGSQQHRQHPYPTSSNSLDSRRNARDTLPHDSYSRSQPVSIEHYPRRQEVRDLYPLDDRVQAPRDSHPRDFREKEARDLYPLDDRVQAPRDSHPRDFRQQEVGDPYPLDDRVQAARDPHPRDIRHQEAREPYLLVDGVQVSRDPHPRDFREKEARDPYSRDFREQEIWDPIQRDFGIQYDTNHNNWDHRMLQAKVWFPEVNRQEAREPYPSVYIHQEARVQNFQYYSQQGTRDGILSDYRHQKDRDHYLFDFINHDARNRSLSHYSQQEAIDQNLPDTSQYSRADQYTQEQFARYENVRRQRSVEIFNYNHQNSSRNESVDQMNRDHHSQEGFSSPNNYKEKVLNRGDSDRDVKEDIRHVVIKVGRDNIDKDSGDKDQRERGDRDKDQRDRNSMDKDQRKRDSRDKDQRDWNSRDKDQRESGDKDKRDLTSKDKEQRERDHRDKDQRDRYNQDKYKRDRDTKNNGNGDNKLGHEDNQDKNQRYRDSRDEDQRDQYSRKKDKRDNDNIDRDQRDRRDKDVSNRDSRDTYNRDRDSRTKVIRYEAQKDINKQDVRDGRERDDKKTTYKTGARDKGDEFNLSNGKYSRNNCRKQSDNRSRHSSDDISETSSNRSSRSVVKLQKKETCEKQELSSRSARGCNDQRRSVSQDGRFKADNHHHSQNRSSRSGKMSEKKRKSVDGDVNINITADKDRTTSSNASTKTKDTCIKQTNVIKSGTEKIVIEVELVDETLMSQTKAAVEQAEKQIGKTLQDIAVATKKLKQYDAATGDSRYNSQNSVPTEHHEHMATTNRPKETKLDKSKKVHTADTSKSYRKFRRKSDEVVSSSKKSKMKNKKTRSASEELISRFSQISKDHSDKMVNADSVKAKSSYRAMNELPALSLIKQKHGAQVVSQLNESTVKNKDKLNNVHTGLPGDDDKLQVQLNLSTEKDIVSDSTEAQIHKDENADNKPVGKRLKRQISVDSNCTTRSESSDSTMDETGATSPANIAEEHLGIISESNTMPANTDYLEKNHKVYTSYPNNVPGTGLKTGMKTEQEAKKEHAKTILQPNSSQQSDSSIKVSHKNKETKNEKPCVADSMSSKESHSNVEIYGNTNEVNENIDFDVGIKQNTKESVTTLKDVDKADCDRNIIKSSQNKSDKKTKSSNKQRKRPSKDNMQMKRSDHRQYAESMEYESGEEGDVEDNDILFTKKEPVKPIDLSKSHKATIEYEPCLPSDEKDMNSQDENTEKDGDISPSGVLLANTESEKSDNQLETQEETLEYEINLPVDVKREKPQEEDTGKDVDISVIQIDDDNDDAEIKEEPDWAEFGGYTQEPDVIWVDDDDEKEGSCSQPIINLYSDDEDEPIQSSGTVRVKQERSDWSDIDSCDSDIRIIDVRDYSFSEHEVSDKEDVNDIGTSDEFELPEIPAINTANEFIPETDVTEDDGALPSSDSDVPLNKLISIRKDKIGVEKEVTDYEIKKETLNELAPIQVDEFSSSGDEIIASSAYNNLNLRQIADTKTKTFKDERDIPKNQKHENIFEALTQIDGIGCAGDKKDNKIDIEKVKGFPKKFAKNTSKKDNIDVYAHATQVGSDSDVEVFEYHSEHLAELTQRNTFSDPFEVETQIVERSPTHSDQNMDESSSPLSDVYNADTQADFQVILSDTSSDRGLGSDTSQYDDPQQEFYFGQHHMTPSAASKLGISIQKGMCTETVNTEVPSIYDMETQIDSESEHGDNIDIEEDFHVVTGYSEDEESENENEINTSDEDIFNQPFFPTAADNVQLPLVDTKEETSKFDAETQVDSFTYSISSKKKQNVTQDDRYEVMTQVDPSVVKNEFELDSGSDKDLYEAATQLDPVINDTREENKSGIPETYDCMTQIKSEPSKHKSTLSMSITLGKESDRNIDKYECDTQVDPQFPLFDSSDSDQALYEAATQIDSVKEPVTKKKKKDSKHIPASKEAKTDKHMKKVRNDEIKETDKSLYEMSTQKDTATVTSSREKAQRKTSQDERYNLMTQVDQHSKTNEKPLDDSDSDQAWYEADTQIDPVVNQSDNDMEMLTDDNEQTDQDHPCYPFKNPYLDTTQIQDAECNDTIDTAQSISTASTSNSLKRSHTDTVEAKLSVPVPIKKARKAIEIPILNYKPRPEKRKADPISPPAEPDEPKFPQPRPAIFLENAKKKDMWLSKDTGKTADSSKGKKPARKRKRSNSKENVEAIERSKIQEARRKLKERNVQAIVRPDLIADPAKKVKHSTAEPCPDMDNVDLPTCSQIVQQGLPVMNYTGILLKKSAPKTVPTSRFPSRAAALTETMIATSDADPNKTKPAFAPQKSSVSSDVTTSTSTNKSISSATSSSSTASIKHASRHKRTSSKDSNSSKDPKSSSAFKHPSVSTSSKHSAEHSSDSITDKHSGLPELSKQSSVPVSTESTHVSGSSKSSTKHSRHTDKPKDSSALFSSKQDSVNSSTVNPSIQGTSSSSNIAESSKKSSSKKHSSSSSKHHSSSNSSKHRSSSSSKHQSSTSSSKKHDSENSSKKHDSENSSKKYDSESSSKNHDSENSSKKHDSENSSKKHDSESSSKKHYSENSSKKHDSESSSKHHSSSSSSKHHSSSSSSKSHSSTSSSKKHESSRSSKNHGSSDSSKNNDSENSSKIQDSSSASKHHSSTSSSKNHDSSISSKNHSSSSSSKTQGSSDSSKTSSSSKHHRSSSSSKPHRSSNSEHHGPSSSSKHPSKSSSNDHGSSDSSKQSSSSSKSHSSSTKPSSAADPSKLLNQKSTISVSPPETTIVTRPSSLVKQSIRTSVSDEKVSSGHGSSKDTQTSLSRHKHHSESGTSESNLTIQMKSHTSDSNLSGNKHEKTQPERKPKSVTFSNIVKELGPAEKSNNESDRNLAGSKNSESHMAGRIKVNQISSTHVSQTTTNTVLKGTGQTASVLYRGEKLTVRSSAASTGGSITTSSSTVHQNVQISHTGTHNKTTRVHAEQKNKPPVNDQNSTAPSVRPTGNLMAKPTWKQSYAGKTAQQYVQSSLKPTVTLPTQSMSTQSSSNTPSTSWAGQGYPAKGNSFRPSPSFAGPSIASMGPSGDNRPAKPQSSKAVYKTQNSFQSHNSATYQSREQGKEVGVSWNKFLLAMLYWNPLWFEEREKKRSRGAADLPPIAKGLQSSNDGIPLLGKYQTFQEYGDIMLPLLLHETWESCAQTWSTRRNNAHHMKMMINQQTVAKDGILELNLIGIENKDAKRSGKCFNCEDMLHVNFTGSHQNGKEQKMNMTGFVDNVIITNRSVDKLFNIHPDFKKMSTPNSKILELTIKLRNKQYSFNTTHLVDLKYISSLVTTKRQFFALTALQHSPLCHDILTLANRRTFFDRAPASIHSLQGQFNSSQSEAVNTAAKIVCLPQEEKRICLLQGPPGTGKSHTIIGIIKSILKVKRNCSICLCAPSNAAVDELLCRLKKLNARQERGKVINFVRIGKKSSIHPDVQQYCLDSLIDMKIIQGKKEMLYQKYPSLPVEIKTLEDQIETYKKLIRETEDQYQKMKMNNDLKKLVKNHENLSVHYKLDFSNISTDPQRPAFRREVLGEASVIAGTLSSIGGGQLRSCKRKFDIVIIDEATQAIELDTLIPLQFGATKLILVGDPAQLPPTVVSQFAKDKRLDLSLFKRLYSNFSNDDPRQNPVILLNTQYRMDPEIAFFPGSYIYEGKLLNDRSLMERRSSKLVPYLLYDIQEGQEHFSQTSSALSNESAESRSNVEEAYFTAELCSFIFRQTRIAEKEIGIIAPYAKQKDEITEMLQKRGLLKVQVSTVDAFQGQEKHVIIMSCVRANDTGDVGFVGSRERMNVALTRARYAMYLVGHFDFLEVNDEWKALIANAKDRKLICPVKSQTVKEAIKLCVNPTK